jgi:[ribosomal protein S5]-alanine N-acetyltransferase
MPGVPEPLLTLKTERLILRKMTLADAEDIFDYARNPEVGKYVNWFAHDSIADTERFLDSVLANYETEAGMDWAIVHKQDQKVIGTCGLFNWDLTHHRAELGYTLSQPYWNQGYMTEAVKAAIAFGFHVMMLNHIVSNCNAENIASVRVLQKAGMVEYKTDLRQYICSKDIYWDIKLFSIFKPKVPLY